MKSFVKRTISKATLYYTIITVLFSLIVLLFNSSEISVSLDPSRLLLFLPFCLCLAIANTTLLYHNIEAVTRWLVHFSLTVISAFLFIILPAKLQSSNGNFMGFIIIIAIYFIATLVYFIVNKRIKRTIEEDKRLKTRSDRKTR